MEVSPTTILSWVLWLDFRLKFKSENLSLTFQIWLGFTPNLNLNLNLNLVLLVFWCQSFEDSTNHRWKLGRF